MSEESAAEIDAEIAGQKLRAKGYRLVDLVWLPLMIAVAYTANGMYEHRAEAKDDAAKIATTLKDSNQNVAAALKDNNTSLTETLRAMTSEQKKGNAVMREMVCLSDPLMKNRGDAREFCKRMSRDDR